MGVGLPAGTEIDAGNVFGEGRNTGQKKIGAATATATARAAQRWITAVTASKPTSSRTSLYRAS